MEETSMLRVDAGNGLAATGLPGPTDMAEWAENRLRGNSYLALKNISCEFEDGVLTLRGCVPSYYLKQVAQEAVAPLEGAARIVNQIAVVATGLRGAFRN
jgi:osmotically-inducible protein OsmY